MPNQFIPSSSYDISSNDILSNASSSKFLSNVVHVFRLNSKILM